MTREEVIKAMALRFTSGNDVPVERAWIRKEEWEALINEQPTDSLVKRLRGMTVITADNVGEVFDLLLEAADVLEARAHDNSLPHVSS